MEYNVLITGGAGFIGSNFARMLVGEQDIEHITILDKLTYAGSLDNIEDILKNRKIEFIEGDIAEPNDARRAMQNIDWLVNFAAESHVDRSLTDASQFMRTNIEGVRTLLEIARDIKLQKFIQISTDEVYGPVLSGATDENAPLKPSSPYSASKAAADMLCNAYLVSFDVPVIIARSANNYGSHQYPEKLIPRFVSLAMQNKKLPLYGDGKYVRDWLFVEDNCRAILLLLEKGKIGEIYNIGASELHQNIEVAKTLLDILEKPKTLLTNIKDRLGHDRRYCVDWSKIEKLGWKPQAEFRKQFEKTILWYRDRIEYLNEKSQEAENFYSKT